MTSHATLGMVRLAMPSARPPRPYRISRICKGRASAALRDVRANRQAAAQRLVLARAADDSSASSVQSEPKTSRDAINAGLELYQAQNYNEAIAMWQKALELPGSGSMRMSGTVREYSCPSEGEENSALYNMACAYTQTGQTGPALTCIKGVLENGFDDFTSIRSDADLQLLQGGDLEELIGKYEKPMDKINQLLGRKKKKDSGTNKPWLLW